MSPNSGSVPTLPMLLGHHISSAPWTNSFSPCSEQVVVAGIPSFSPQNYQSSSEACALCRQFGSWPALLIPGEGIFLQSLRLLSFPPGLLQWPTLFLDEAGALQRLPDRGPNTAPSCRPPASGEPLIRCRMAGFVNPPLPRPEPFVPPLHPTRWAGAPGLREEGNSSGCDSGRARQGVCGGERGGAGETE